ncbi:MAG: glycosyltransferase [Bacillota bacterium]|nr:glycosyltransferase [Bacillota bacterium]
MYKDDIIISVVMVTYNHEEYLKQAIESILMQQVNFNYEIVIGEDCSPDNSRRILREFENRYPGKFNIVYRNKNIGPTKNLYDLFTKCNGKYVAILEGDDYWTDFNKLKMQVDFMEGQSEYSGTCHIVSIIDKYNEVVGNIPTREFINRNRLSEIENIDRYIEYIYEETGQGIHVQSLVFKNIFSSNDDSEKIKKLLTTTNYVSDIQTIALILRYGKIKFIDKNMGRYRRIIKEGNTSYSSQGAMTSYLETINSWKLIDEYYELKFHGEINNVIFKYKAIYIFKLLRNKDFKNIKFIFECDTIEDKIKFFVYISSFIIKKIQKKLKIKLKESWLSK